MSNNLMLRDYNIEKFVPPSFSLKKLDLDALKLRTGKSWLLTSSGTASLIRIFQTFPSGSKILIPSFICSSVLRAVKEGGCTPIFYDIDPRDLNGDLTSAGYLADCFAPKAILVASLFGNPANLLEFEKLAQQKKMFLIDDAAQSFGASLDGRMLGTFGDAGLFSFSPGKSTAGHMGSLFWDREIKEYAKSENFLFSFIKFYDFYFNRLNTYRYNKYKSILKILSYLNLMISRTSFFCKMTPNFKDQLVMGGIMECVQNGDYDWREQWAKKVNHLLSMKKTVRMISSIRGESVSFKIVLIFTDDKSRDDFKRLLAEKSIYFSSSYVPYLNEWTENTKNINGKVVELPLENDDQKMNYLMNVLNTIE